jgi:hypothetical protein
MRLARASPVFTNQRRIRLGLEKDQRVRAKAGGIDRVGMAMSQAWGKLGLLHLFVRARRERVRGELAVAEK